MQRGSKPWLVAMRAYYPGDEDVQFLCNAYEDYMKLQYAMKTKGELNVTETDKSKPAPATAPAAASLDTRAGAGDGDGTIANDRDSS